MARLELINICLQHPVIEGTNLHWEPSSRTPLTRLPQIFWSSNIPWREANLWAYEKLSEARTDHKTVLSAMTHVCAYAKWLEKELIVWWHFPVKQSERCLVRFRGAVVEMRNQGVIAPSTATQRMSAVIKFYRWLIKNSLISAERALWNDITVGIRLTDGFGLQRTMKVASTELAIPNRKRPGDLLEDGLLPVSKADVIKIMKFAEVHATEELYLMLKLGFGTGMRFGSIAGLKIETLERAIEDPGFKGFYRISLGPGASPPIHTKFGVTGEVWMHGSDLENLRNYFYSTRRLLRQTAADEGCRSFVFLNRFGRPYGNDGLEISRGISVEMGRLRRKGYAAGISALRSFKFHQSRCTFATELARAGLKHGNTAVAVNLVMQALLHKDEKTTLGYIKFVEKSALMAEAANEFTRDFLGLATLRTEPDA